MTHATWFESLRAEGLKRWQEIGLPMHGEENWKYTSLLELRKRQFMSSAQLVETPRWRQIREDVSVGGREIVFVNGHYSPQLSNLSALGAGIRVGSLAQSLRADHTHQRQIDDTTLLQQALDYYPADQEESFVAQNRAHFEDGCLVVVDDGVQVAGVLHLVYICDPASAPDLSAEQTLACYPRTVVHLGEGSRLQMLESYVGFSDSQYLTNSVLDTHLATRADFFHCQVQNEAMGAFHVTTHRAHQARQSVFSSFVMTAGSRLSRHNLLIKASGAETTTTLNGLYLINGTQHADFCTQLEHLQVDGVSRQHYKGILGDRARAVFKGQIHIAAEAQRVDSSQLNNNLLLSSQAEVDTLPQLRIDADDVKATHGATVGQLNEEELFYLESRAIDRERARQMVLRGFAEDLLERLPAGVLSQKVHQVVDVKLNEMMAKKS